VEATPKRQERPDGLGGTQRIGVLGIEADPQTFTFKRDDPLTAMIHGVRETGNIVERTLTYLGRLLRGRESAEQLTGPIGIGQVVGAIPTITGKIYLAAVLSVSIGLFNLFPIPMLDGGHLFFYLIEAVRRRPLSPRTQDLGFRIGFALVLMLLIFATFNDIANRSGIFVDS
jgi:regulator of sigma E protease